MIEVQRLPKYEILYDLPAGTFMVILIGGRGGAKSYEASKFIAFSATIKKKRCVLLRDEKSHARESILNDILLRYDTANENGALNQLYQRMDSGIKDRQTREMVVFTKGFRASTKQKRANLKSISNVDIALIEEGEDIRDPDQFNTFIDGIRNEGAIVMVLLNTPDIQHFLIKRYFNLTPAKKDNGDDLDGFFDITPKDIPGFLCIQTDFTDNPHLPAHVVQNYNNYGNPNADGYNEFYYYSAIKGYATTGRRGQILKKVKPISLKDYLAIQVEETYAQDWGTASPAGMVGLKFEGNNSYARQLNYKPMGTLQIACFWAAMGLTKRNKIVGDSAEPDTIRQLQNGYTNEQLKTEPLIIQRYPQIMKGRGFWVIPCLKPKGSVNSGLSIMDGMNLFAVSESVDLWEEVNNYIWEMGMDGLPTNNPIDKFNHLIDPWRYGCEERARQRTAGVRRGN